MALLERQLSSKTVALRVLRAGHAGQHGASKPSLWFLSQIFGVCPTCPENSQVTLRSSELLFNKDVKIIENLQA